MRRAHLILKLRQTLHRRRAALCRLLSEHSEFKVFGPRSVGDDVDAAGDAEQDELDLQLAAVESRELIAIDAALERIREGRYGICDICARPISAARLQALPFANLCVKCQSQTESGHTEHTSLGHWKRVPEIDLEHDDAALEVSAW